MSTNILIGVTGGISAYKVASVVSVLHDKGHDVKVIMTESAKKFVGPLTFSALSHNPVYDDAMEFSANGHITHIELSEWADLFIIAPLTANTGAKIENGMADNLLTSTALAFNKKPVLGFPAMNTKMWEKFKKTYVKDKYVTVDVDNSGFKFLLKNLYSMPMIYIYPETGKMACGSIGEGKLPNTKSIVNLIERIVA